MIKHVFGYRKSLGANDSSLIDSYTAKLPQLRSIINGTYTPDQQSKERATTPNAAKEKLPALSSNYTFHHRPNILKHNNSNNNTIEHSSTADFTEQTPSMERNTIQHNNASSLEPNSTKDYNSIRNILNDVSTTPSYRNDDENTNHNITINTTTANTTVHVKTTTRDYDDEGKNLFSMFIFSM